MQKYVLSLCLFLAGTIMIQAADEKEVTLTGTFRWVKNGKEKTDDRELKAVFKPTGENTWSVSFYFKWGKRDKVYTGTATGDLKTGKLSGEAKGERNNSRSWTFTGEFDKAGVFKGTHKELTKGREGDTGVMVLKHAAVKE